MRRKEDDYNLLRPGNRHPGRARPRLPKGVVTGVQLETVLRRAVQGEGLPPLRRPADSVPRRGDRPRDRQGRGLQRRRTRQRDARQHVGAGRGGAGGVRRHDAGRRHAHQQPAGGNRARDGRRRRHRGERRHAAAQARGAELDPRRGRADAQHPDRAERAGLARLAETDRHPDLAGTGRFLDRGFRQPAEDRCRIGEAAARKVADRLAQLSHSAGRIRRAAQAPADGRWRPTRGRSTRSASTTCERVNPQAAQAVMETQAGQPLDQPRCSTPTCAASTAPAISST